MILIDVLQRIPGFERLNSLQIALTVSNHSSPGYVKVGKRLKWTATVDDHQDGQIIIVTVEHDEALDPEEGDVQIIRSDKYIVTTSASTIVRNIVKEMDDYHN